MGIVCSSSRSSVETELNIEFTPSNGCLDQSESNQDSATEP
jgi:hypothetical protein